MDKKNRENKQFITKSILEKSLKNQSKVILSTVDKRFKQVDKRFEQVDWSFKQISQTFGDISNRFKTVDEEIREKFDKVLTGQDEICKQLSDLIQENNASTLLYKKHDKKIEQHEKRIGNLELDIQQVVHK